jgi:hypothetical protein
MYVLFFAWNGYILGKGNEKKKYLYKYLVLTIALIELSTRVDYGSERGLILRIVPIPYNGSECFVTNLQFYIASCTCR